MPDTATPTHASGRREASSESARTLRTGHFLRQSILTQRKLATAVNRRWCENQLFCSKTKPWTP